MPVAPSAGTWLKRTSSPLKSALVELYVLFLLLLDQGYVILLHNSTSSMLYVQMAATTPTRINRTINLFYFTSRLDLSAVFPERSWPPTAPLSRSLSLSPQLPLRCVKHGLQISPPSNEETQPDWSDKPPEEPEDPRSGWRGWRWRSAPLKGQLTSHHVLFIATRLSALAAASGPCARCSGVVRTAKTRHCCLSTALP